MNKSEIQTKDGVTYSHVSAIGETSLVPSFYKNVAELMEVGYCTFHTFSNVTDSTQAIIAEIDNKIVGYDLFNHYKESKIMFGFFIYVDPDYRQRGIITQTLRCVVKHAKDNKVDFFQGLISIKNEISIQAHIKAGFDLFISEDSPEYYEFRHSTY